jgi:hypothetical protein
MARDPQKQAVYNQRRYVADKERCKVDPEFRAHEARRARNRQLKHAFGITLAEYEQMLATQNGVCKICKGPPVGRPTLAVDHCHDTGRVRGLLCSNCNTGIGCLQEKPEIFAAAIMYLVEHNQAFKQLGMNPATGNIR